MASLESPQPPNDGRKAIPRPHSERGDGAAFDDRHRVSVEFGCKLDWALDEHGDAWLAVLLTLADADDTWDGEEFAAMGGEHLSDWLLVTRGRCQSRRLGMPRGRR